MWFVGPGTAYVIERTIRIIRGSKPVLLVKAVQVPCLIFVPVLVSVSVAVAVPLYLHFDICLCQCL